MEPNDWLVSYADAATAGKLASLSLAGGGGQASRRWYPGPVWSPRPLRPTS